MHSTPDDTHSYTPRADHGLPHDPFNATVGPRPGGWMGTRDGAGHFNLAPYGFFNGFNDLPPIVQLLTAEGRTVPTGLVLCEVVAVHTARRRLVNGLCDTAAAEPELRGGGQADCFSIGAELGIKMHRPR